MMEANRITTRIVVTVLLVAGLGGPAATADHVPLFDEESFTSGARWVQWSFELEEPAAVGTGAGGLVKQGDATFGGWLGVLTSHKDDGSSRIEFATGRVVYVNPTTPGLHVRDEEVDAPGIQAGFSLDLELDHLGVRAPFVAPLDGFDGGGSTLTATYPAGNYTFFGWAASDGTFSASFELYAEQGEIQLVDKQVGDGFLFLNEDFQGAHNLHVETTGSTADVHWIEDGQLPLVTDELTHYWYGTFNNVPDAELWYETPDRVEEGFSQYAYVFDAAGPYTFHVDREQSVSINAACFWHEYNEQIGWIHSNPENSCGSPAVWLFGFQGDLPLLSG